MKKIFLILALLLIPNSSVFALETTEVYTPIFLSRFLKCIPCKMEQTIVTANGNIQITRLLRNWKDHKCRYTEIKVQNNKKEEFSCNLSREQVNTLTAAMKSDPMGKSTAGAEWAKVIKDKNTCQIAE